MMVGTRILHESFYDYLWPLLSIHAIVVVFLFIAIWRAITKHIKKLEIVERLPGPPLTSEGKDFDIWMGNYKRLLDSFGHIPFYPNVPDPFKFYSLWSDQYAEHGLFRVWFLNPYRFLFARPNVFIHDPMLCRQLLEPISASKKLIKPPRIYAISSPVVGNSFLALPDNKEWKHQRRLAVPAFSQRVLEEACTVSYDLLNRAVFPYLSSRKTKIDAVEITTRLTLDVVGQVAFSYHFRGLETYCLDGQDKHDSLYSSFDILLTGITRQILNVPYTQYLPTSANFAVKRASKHLETVVQKVVETRLKEQLDSEKKGKEGTERKDLLAQLLLQDENGHRLPVRNILGNVRMFLFAGHETTAATLARALWALANDEPSQMRLREEVDSLYAVSDSPTYRQLKESVFLDAVLREILRLHAPAGIARRTIEDITLTKEMDDGKKIEYLLPAGINLLIFPAISQTMEKYEPYRPKDFVPDRWLTSKRSKNWMPFSVGPRNCIGEKLAMAELKACIAHIIRHFYIRPSSCAVEPIPVLLLTIKPNQVHLDFERRVDT
eukprot:CAMPEP_0194425640 /NCGR_PEP_ID=MMETSP0176-20130528/24871_1 /TAXON_ID=216777 /ORGANISM="Proboscia alata, Strain PI-D3" /LENGTH=549 /DNA_ID=CAMNT_0039236011 /DNA_START=66 /DNA_END=1718 /DNA_ORIENTATION=+